MKKIRSIVMALLLVCIAFPLFSQGFTPPEESNAVVYFPRVTKFGKAVSFEYFDGEEFIGVFKGKNYMRYECPAGKHLLWASSENKQFVECDLEAGKTYIILVNVSMGAWKAQLNLEPLTVDNEDFDRVKELIDSKAPIITSPEKIESTMKKLNDRGFIENIMEHYENEWKGTDRIKTLSADMFIPKERLQ
jgi:hypothetical protein